MKEIPDKSVDMILCDLPYGTTKCKWDSIIPFDLLWEQYDRIAKDNAAVVLFGSEPFSSQLRLSNVKNYKYDYYMRKSIAQGFANVKKMPLKDIETISVFYKKQPTYNPQGVIRVDRVVHNSSGKVNNKKHISGQNGGAMKEGNYIQEYTNYPKQVIDVSSRRNANHPTEKPVDICDLLIKTYTSSEGVVLDNCMGSGTTGVAAIGINRRFIGIEMDTTYCDIAKKRIQDVDSKYA